MGEMKVSQFLILRCKTLNNKSMLDIFPVEFLLKTEYFLLKLTDMVLLSSSALSLVVPHSGQFL